MDFVRSYFSTIADLEKKWGQKCSTGQRFICIEVTSYKIHTFTMSAIYGFHSKNNFGKKNRYEDLLILSLYVRSTLCQVSLKREYE